MATLTAAAHPENGTVTLRLDTAQGVTGILRTDVNGTRPVRLRSGDLAGSAGRELVDYEAALSGSIMYRLEDQPGESVWVSLGGCLPRFHLPSIPQFAVEAQAVTAYEAERTSRAVFHDVIDRPDPMVAQAPMGTRAGTLTVTFDAYPQIKDLADVLERGQTVMFRQPEHPGQDMYFHAERVRTQAMPDEDAWELQISFREIIFPTGNVLSRPGWTFDALAVRHESFDEVARAYGTFHDLTIGEAGQ